MSNFPLSSQDIASTALVGVVLVGLIAAHLWRRRVGTFKEGFLPVSDWRPTGHIDFIDLENSGERPRPAPTFLLRAEDYRILESMAVSGAKQVEFRWRNATLVEAKHVVSHHNSSVSTIDDYLPWTIRNPHIIPNPANAAAKPALELNALSSAANEA